MWEPLGFTELRVQRLLALGGKGENLVNTLIHHGHYTLGAVNLSTTFYQK